MNHRLQTRSMKKKASASQDSPAAGAKAKVRINTKAAHKAVAPEHASVSKGSVSDVSPKLQKAAALARRTDTVTLRSLGEDTGSLHFSRVPNSLASLFKRCAVLLFFYFLYLLVESSNALLSSHVESEAEPFHLHTLLNGQVKIHAEQTMGAAKRVSLRVLVCLFVSSSVAQHMTENMIWAKGVRCKYVTAALALFSRFCLFHLYYTATDLTLRSHFPPSVGTAVLLFTLYWLVCVLLSPTRISYFMAASLYGLSVLVPLYYATFHRSFAYVHFGWMFDRLFYRWAFRAAYVLADWLNNKCLWIGRESLPLFTALADDATTVLLPSLTWSRLSAKLGSFAAGVSS